MSSGSTVIIRDKKGKVYKFFPMASSFQSILLSDKYYQTNNDQLIINYFKKLGFQHKEFCPDDFYGITVLDFKEGFSLEANQAGSLTSMSIGGLSLFLKGHGISSWSDDFDKQLFNNLTQEESFKNIISNNNEFLLKNYNGEMTALPFDSSNYENWVKFFKNNITNKYYQVIFNNPLKNICSNFNKKNLQFILDWVIENDYPIKQKEIKKWKEMINAI